MIPLAAGVIGLDYLRRLLLPPVGNTSPVGAPFTPPFPGGQCVGAQYTFKIDYRVDINGVDTSIFGFARDENAVGPFRGVEVVDAGSSYQWYLLDGNGRTFLYGFPKNPSRTNARAIISNVVRTNGLDNCGNLPNPNAAPPIGSDGLASGGGVTASTGSPLVQGAPIVAIPSIKAIVTAIGSAVRAAVDVLSALKDVMDAINAIGGILDAIRDWIDGQEKDKPKNKNLFRFDYGSIKKDGFLRLYPEGEIQGFEPTYIDLQLLSIPIGYGKYFGELSPNFYRFRSLGHISFVSSSFGVLETREIEFSRTSLNVPSNAYGFFYHLGLEDAIRANVSLFYLQSVTTQEE